MLNQSLSHTRLHSVRTPGLTPRQRELVHLSYEVAVQAVMIDPLVLEDKRPHMASRVRNKILK